MEPDLCNVICFGGPLDGQVHHAHSDPPFGYVSKYIRLDDERRRYFLYAQMRRKLIDTEVVSSAIRSIHVSQQ